jgi:hypothetical protein
MGVWGTRLYSGDFAMDLRSTISAVSRLPFEIERLVDIICEREPGAANNPNDEDHTTFWLVMADQFAKRGIVSDRVRDKALDIIDGKRDLAMLEKLGMKQPDLAKRGRMLQEVRERVIANTDAKPRKVLKKPQPLLMSIGDVLVYPTCDGEHINPYFPSKEQIPVYRPGGPAKWEQNGWAAIVIVDCGRAFEFLSWYRPLTIRDRRTEKPTLSSLHGDVQWQFELPGTCSPLHFKKMEMEKLATLPIDPERVKTIFPELRPGISAAVNDISIANRMKAYPRADPFALPKPGEPLKGRARVIIGIEQLFRQ